MACYARICYNNRENRRVGGLYACPPGIACVCAKARPEETEGLEAMPRSSGWTVIHMAHSEAHAKAILALLAEEGFLARSRQVYRTVSSEDNYYEIMVPGAEAREAQQLLIERNLLL